MKRTHILKFSVLTALITGVLVHIGISIHANGGWSYVFQPPQTSDKIIAHFFMLGLATAPYAILAAAQMTLPTVSSQLVILLSTIGMFSFDLYAYSTIQSPVEGQWQVILLPIIGLLPASIIAFILAFIFRGEP